MSFTRPPLDDVTSASVIDNSRIRCRLDSDWSVEATGPSELVGSTCARVNLMPELLACHGVMPARWSTLTAFRFRLVCCVSASGRTVQACREYAQAPNRYLVFVHHSMKSTGQMSLSVLKNIVEWILIGLLENEVDDCGKCSHRCLVSVRHWGDVTSASIIDCLRLRCRMD